MIKKYRWKCRVLLIKTPDYKNQKYKKAKELYRKDIKHFHKRIVKLVSKKTGKDFSIELFGFDGAKKKSFKNFDSKKIFKIIDLDVHQGNGNSEIFKNDKDVLTFSMHCASNYPAKKSKSDIDIELKDHMEDEEYLNILHNNLKELNENKYDFAFYVAGVDIHFEDRLGKLKISDEGVNKRDQMVIENFYSKNIPLCGVLGGGYNKNFDKLIELHSMLHKNCAKII